MWIRTTLPEGGRAVVTLLNNSINQYRYHGYIAVLSIINIIIMSNADEKQNWFFFLLFKFKFGSSQRAACNERISDHRCMDITYYVYFNTKQFKFEEGGLTKKNALKTCGSAVIFPIFLWKHTVWSECIVETLQKRKMKNIFSKTFYLGKSRVFYRLCIWRMQTRFVTFVQTRFRSVFSSEVRPQSVHVCASKSCCYEWDGGE